MSISMSMSTMGESSSSMAAKRFVDFLNESGSPYHSVLAVKRRLLSSNFEQLAETAPWKLRAGGKYFVHRENSEIFAFCVGGKFSASEAASPAFLMVGAHTDSPCLMLRPHSAKVSGQQLLQLGVQTYGGGLWHTWLDRGLGVAGKLVVKHKSTGMLAEHLVRVARPICFIPNLAIHLQSGEERKALELNPETALVPVLATTAVPAGAAAPAVASGHHSQLLETLLTAAGLSSEAVEVSDLSLCLFDAQPAELAGLAEEFVLGGRIDNQLSTFAAFEGLLNFAGAEAQESGLVAIAAAFDHEEVGSLSCTGADSLTVNHWLDRIFRSLGVAEGATGAVASRSFLVSADCAHGSHPNFPGKTQPEHKVGMGRGVVIKHNANMRYATSVASAAIVRRVAELQGVQIQDFVVKNDSPCGSTIGPSLAANLGVRTVDIGAPQWAMHSCRESCHVGDVEALVKLCTGLYRHYVGVNENFAPIF